MAKNVQKNKGAKVKHKCKQQRWPMCNNNSNCWPAILFFPYNLAWTTPFKLSKRCVYIIIILLPEKFLPFDLLRAEVFQLNLKYLHVKITVTMVTQNHQIISSHELRKNGGKILRFWNQEIQELKENSENWNAEKSTSTWLNVWTSWPKTRTSKPICLPMKRNNSTKINTWR